MRTESRKQRVKYEQTKHGCPFVPKIDCNPKRLNITFENAAFWKLLTRSMHRVFYILLESLFICLHYSFFDRESEIISCKALCTGYCWDSL